MRRSTKGDQHQVGDVGSRRKRGDREVKGCGAEKGVKAGEVSAVMGGRSIKGYERRRRIRYDK